MQLSVSQLQTLKTAIAAEVDSTFAALRTAGDEQGMADFYNADTSPAWYAWRPSTVAAEVFNAITWASLTPADTPDSTATYTNRALLCQAKQINLQILLQGQSWIATGKATIRQGLNDALQNVPAGSGGALLDAGWAGAGKVKAAISRVVTRGEKLYASGTGTAGQPGDMTQEGRITAQNISDALRA